MQNIEKVLDVFSERFDHILPDKTDAKVLFCIFLQVSEHPDKNCFSEVEIKELIRKFQREGTYTEREQRQKIEERLQGLLRDHFIDRNKERKILLTDYSSQLCQLFIEKIHPLLNPSEIEKTLEDVKTTLEIHCKSLDGIIHWYNTQFLKVLKPELANQVIALDYQIAQMENDLNEKSKSLPFVELLDYFNVEMEVVISDRRKLTKSFNGLDGIIDILAETSLNKLNSVDFIRIKSSLNETLEHYKFKLEKTEERISQIKRIAGTFFDKMDKKPFYRKLEAFLYQILSNSNSNKKANKTDKEDNLIYDVEIVLPDSVKVIEIVKDFPETFLYPDFHDDFSISKNQKSAIIPKNTDHLKIALENSKRRKEQAKRIEFWLKNLKDRIELIDEIDYSPFYLEMLEKEKDIEIAIKGTEHILKKLRQENYQIEVTNQFIINPTNPNNSIWNIKIKKPF